MSSIQKTLGTICDKCPLCRYARKNQDTLFGRFMSWHGRWCPAWSAQKELERSSVLERKGK